MPARLNVNSAPISLAQLSTHAGHDLFAILDACDEPLVPIKIDELGSRGSCLYSGKASVNYRGIAPYLVEVDEDLLGWIVSTLSHNPWGIFMVTAAPFLELRKHLRRFLLVKLPDDRTVYFRFYDPRVIPTFLKSCDVAETAAFFGPVEKIVVQDEFDQKFMALERNSGSSTDPVPHVSRSPTTSE